MNHTRTILPTFDVFDSASDAPIANRPDSADGLGRFRLFALSPVVAAVQGLGDDAVAPALPGVAASPVSGSGVLGIAAFLGIVGFASYQAAAAMAPSRGDRSHWGWIGVPVGLFTGVVGLGVMGFVAKGKG